MVGGSVLPSQLASSFASKETSSITYALPGQIGFCIPRIAQEPQYLQNLLELLAAENSVLQVQVNSTAASLVITYESKNSFCDQQMRSRWMELIQLASQKTEPPLARATKQEQSKVACSITYALPGQIGFCIPRIAQEPQYLQNLLELLAAENSVLQVQVNSTAASLVITYESKNSFCDQQMRSRWMELVQLASQKTKIQPSSSHPTTNTNFQSRPQPDRKNKQPNAAGAPSAASKSVSSLYQKPAQKVTYSIVHSIPGRVRFRVPRLAQDPKYVQRLQALLKADWMVLGERINVWASSIVIAYKQALHHNCQKPQGNNAVEAAIYHLASLLQKASEVAIA